MSSKWSIPIPVQSPSELEKSLRKANQYHKNWQKEKDKLKAKTCIKCGYCLKEKDLCFDYKCKENQRGPMFAREANIFNCDHWISITDYLKRTEATRILDKGW